MIRFKKILWVLLLCGAVSARAGILAYMYGKCVTTARFICSPIRRVVAPFFVLKLATERDLHRVMLLELTDKFDEKVNKQMNSANQNEILAALSAQYTTMYNLRAKLMLSFMPHAVQHDTLSFWERVFTNRQQQLDGYCRTICTSLQKYEKYAQESRIQKAKDNG